MPEPTQHRSLRQRIVEWLLREHVTETRRLIHELDVAKAGWDAAYTTIEQVKKYHEQELAALRERFAEWFKREHISADDCRKQLQDLSKAIEYVKQSHAKELQDLRTIVADLGVQQKQGPLHARNFSQVRQFMGNQEDVA